MDNVKKVAFDDRNEQPDPEVVAICEAALARAKSGELRSVMMFGLLRGNLIWREGRWHDSVMMVGGLEMMKESVIRKTMAPDYSG